MKFLTPLAAAALLIPCLTAKAAVTVNAVGVYDPTTHANVVDSTAPGSSETLAIFAGLIGEAFSINMGGVINFESGQVVPIGDPAPDTVYNFRYGSALSKSLRVTTSVSIDYVPGVSADTGTVTPISGSGVLANQTGSPDITFTLGPITSVATGNALDEVVESFAFTLLSRNNYPVSGNNFTIIATFDDLSTFTIPATNIGNVKGTDDTFFSITAPEGRYITSVTVDSEATTAAINPVFDDLAFRTRAIPEPSTGLLLLAGGMVAGLRRRRR